jgi:hypothetical protein
MRTGYPGSRPDMAVSTIEQLYADLADALAKGYRQLQTLH